MSAGERPALAKAARITASWAGPLGTVIPLDLPSEFKAEPRITARMGSPAAKASESLLSATKPHPSARTMPSAAASKVLHLPSGASIPQRENSTMASGNSITLTPPANARSHSPVRNDLQAIWIALSDDEQAESTTTLGPWRPKLKAIRPESEFRAPP